MLFGLISFLCASFFSYPRERIPSNLLFWTYAGFITVLFTDHFKAQFSSVSLITKSKNLFFSGIIRLAVVILSLLSLTISTIYLYSDHKTKKIIDNYNISSYEKVISDSQNLNDLYNFQSEIFYLRGMAYYQNEDYKQSVFEFQKYLGKNPYSIHGLFNIGLSYLNNKDTENAIKYFKKTINIKPDHNEAILHLGEIFFSEAEFENASEVFNTALIYDPDNYIYLNNNGASFMQMGQYNVADSLFSKAIELYSEYVDALLNSGLNNYANIKNLAKALKDFENVLRLRPDHRQKQRILEYINEIKNLN